MFSLSACERRTKGEKTENQRKGKTRKPLKRKKQRKPLTLFGIDRDGVKGAGRMIGGALVCVSIF